MKAKNICGRLARILAVLMAMTLIISCTAVALAEETESTPATDKNFVMYVAEPDPDSTHLGEVISSTIDESSFSGIEFIHLYTDLFSMMGEDVHIAAIFLDETGIDFITYSEILRPDILFFLDACTPQSGFAPNEDNCAYWAYTLFRFIDEGKHVYIYASNNDSSSAEFTRYFITSFMDIDYSDLGFEITPSEDEEDVYCVKNLATETVGYFHVKALDMSVEEAIPVVSEKFFEVFSNY